MERIKVGFMHDAEDCLELMMMVNGLVGYLYI
jgi:hypothetical protein